MNLLDPVAMGRKPAKATAPQLAPKQLQSQSAVTLYDRPFRISVFGNSPYLTSGYANQTALFVERCKKFGIEVSVIAMAGEEYAGKMYPTRYGPVPIYPKNRNRADEYSERVLGRWAKHFESDVCIHFLDADVLQPELYPDVRVVAQYPVDCEPIAPVCLTGLRQAWARVSYSEHGFAWTKDAGLDSYYIPHGVETGIFTPGDKTEARIHCGLPANRFIVGVVAANFDRMPTRKGWEILFEGFALFKETESGKDALLYLHTSLNGSVSIPWLIREHGLKPDVDVLWCDQDQNELGIPKSEMVALYRAFDVMALCSMGEGFGLPLLEAQSCGCPVICGDWTAMEQLCFAGIHIQKENAVRMRGHRGMWQYRMDPRALADALQLAHLNKDNAEVKEDARTGALPYDFDRIFERMWLPAIQDWAERIEREDEPKRRPRPARSNPAEYTEAAVAWAKERNPQILLVSPSHNEKCGIAEYNDSCWQEAISAGYRVQTIERTDTALAITRQVPGVDLVLIQHEYCFFDKRHEILGRGESTLHLMAHLRSLCETDAKIGLLLHTISPRPSEGAVNQVLRRAIELGLPVYATSFEGANYLGCKWLPLGAWEEGTLRRRVTEHGSIMGKIISDRAEAGKPLIVGNFGMLGPQRDINAHVELCRATGAKYLGSHYCQSLHHKEALARFIADNADIAYESIWTDYCTNDELLKRLQQADVLYMPRNDIDLLHVSASVITAMSANRPIIVNSTQCYSDMRDYLLVADTVEEAAILLHQLKDVDFYDATLKRMWDYMDSRNIVKVWEAEFGIKARELAEVV